MLFDQDRQVGLPPAPAHSGQAEAEAQWRTDTDTVRLHVFNELFSLNIKGVDSLVHSHLHPHSFFTLTANTVEQRPLQLLGVLSSISSTNMHTATDNMHTATDNMHTATDRDNCE